MKLINGTKYKVTSGGVAVPGALIYTYESGTLTPLATYTTAALSVAHSNPIVTDSNGEAVIFLGASAYRFIEKTSAGVQIGATVDGIEVQDAATTAASAGRETTGVYASATGASADINVGATSVVLVNSDGESVVLDEFDDTITCTTSGISGLDTGTLAADTRYYAYIVAAVTDGVVTASGVCIGASQYTPSLPAYPYYKRICSVKTDATGNKYPLNFMCKGDQVQLVVGANVTSLPTIASGALGVIGTPTWTSQSWSSHAPPYASQLRLVASTTSGTVIVAPNNNYGSATSTTNPPPVRTAYVSTIDMIPESTSVMYACDSANGRLQLLGWTE